MPNAESALRLPAGEGRRSPAPHLRRKSDRSPLGGIVASIEQAFESGDYELAAELFEREPIAAWYGLLPDRFGEIVGVLTKHAAPERVLLSMMSTMLTSGSVDPAGRAGPGLPQPEGVPSESAALVGQVFALRLQGRPVEALRLSAELGRRFGAIQPIFDTQHGWGLFSALQHGVTAMLAGEFATALDSFAQARMHVRVPALVFLSRDACVKAAMIEALYGDHGRARALLDEADGIPRTESWAEEVIDVGQVVAAAFVRIEDPDEALRRLEAVPMHAIGEIWPFYAIAVQRALILADRLGEARQRLALFERLPLPRVEGQGFTGSAPLLGGAMRSMMLGDLGTARAQLERADQQIVATRVLCAVLELAAGRPRKALECTV